MNAWTSLRWRYALVALAHFVISLGGFFYVANVAYVNELAGFEPRPWFGILEIAIGAFLLPLVYPVLYYFELLRQVDEYWPVIIAVFVLNSALVAAIAAFVSAKLNRFRSS